MNLIYFAWVRSRIGHAQETLEPPSGLVTVADLLDHLEARGGGYAAALADRRAIRVAVDQDYVGLEHPIGGAREVAIFPPVTGG